MLRARHLAASLLIGLCALAAAPPLADAGFGPPAGPTTPPFWQCPAVGTSTSCSFLIDLTGDHNNPTTKVVADPSQEFYDAGTDDEIVAVQNDTDGPIAKIHLGVSGSGDNLFGFEGDGLCSPGVGATPTGCPFGGSGNSSDPFDYYGPDMAFEPGYTSDDGVVDFNPPLQPGQYTFFGLDAPCSDVTCDVEIPVGNVNDYLSSSLTDAANTSNQGAHVSRSTPGDVTDQATLNGANANSAAGTVSYKVYKDPNCTQLVADATPAASHFTGGQFNMPASKAVGGALPTDATYYWQVTFTSDNASDSSQSNYNTDASTVCGGETMSFGNPPTRPATGVLTSLSDGTHSGSALAVGAGTPVTDAATVTTNGSPDSSATGTVTYSVYSDAACSRQVPNAFPVHGDIRQVSNGVAPASAAVNLPVGAYYFRAVYSGDSNHASAAASCGAEVLAVKRQTSLGTTLAAGGHSLGASGQVAPGTVVTDTATVLAGGTPASLAGGSVSYALYNAATDPTCAKAPVTTQGNAPVLGGSAAPFTAPALPALKPGRWLIVAAYSGDSQFLAATSACGSEVLTVVPAAVTAAKPTVANGVILNTLTSNTAGTFLVNGQISNAKAVLARAKSKKCRRGTVLVHRRCVSTAFGSTRANLAAAGTITVRLAPNAAARKALARGKTLHVTETITFQPADGSKAATVVLRIADKVSKHKKKKRH